jgi:hypothetical protein
MNRTLCNPPRPFNFTIGFTKSNALPFSFSNITQDSSAISSFQNISMASQLKYENVEFDDHEDSSTTEVEESLMEDEKHMHEEFHKRYATKSKRAACRSILNQGRWFLDTLLLLVIVGLLVRDQAHRVNPKTSENEVGGDLTGVGPHCRQLPETHRITAVI